MQRTFLTLGAAAAVALPSAAIAAKPAHQGPSGGNQTPNLTLSASTDEVLAGRFVTLSGKLTGRDAGGRTIRLEADPYPLGDGYETVGRKQTSSNGSYEIGVRPDRLTRYRTVAEGVPAATSDPVDVVVRRRVTLRVSDRTPVRGQRVTFSGTIVPASAGKTVAIQRETRSGGWFTVARTVARDAGSDLSEFSRSVRVRRGGVYRAKVPRDGALATGYSRTRTLTLR
ncbi:MAG TPA: hypothetical protein VFS08_00580 [Gemmatimonadaceae bacterium]|nr:hypothetical protein [Gemmatimonadaceae bacterium]